MRTAINDTVRISRRTSSGISRSAQSSRRRNRRYRIRTWLDSPCTTTGPTSCHQRSLHAPSALRCPCRPVCCSMPSVRACSSCQPSTCTAGQRYLARGPRHGRHQSPCWPRASKGSSVSSAWRATVSRSLAVQRLNIDAMTSWVFQGLTIDSLPRSLWYTPQHAAACAFGLLALITIVASRPPVPGSHWCGGRDCHSGSRSSSAHFLAASSASCTA